MVLRSSFLRTSTRRSDISPLAFPVAKAESRRASISRSLPAEPVPLAAKSRATTANTPMKTTAIRSMAADLPSLIDLGDAFEQAWRQENARGTKLFEETGTDTARFEDAEHLSVGSDSLLLEGEDFLHRDHVLFHTRDFVNAHAFAGAVTEAGALHNDGDCRGNLVPNRLLRQIEIGHGDHRFQAAQGIARGVRVDGGHRSFVTGVHGLKHVKGFFAAALADDDAVWTHTKTVDQQLSLSDCALSFHVGRTRFEAHDVLLRQLQLGGIFNRDDAFVLRNVLRQDVEEGRLAGAGTAGDQNAQSRAHCRGQQFHHLGGDALQLDKLVGGQRTGSETANGERGAIEGQRGNDGIDTRSIGKAGIDHRRRFINAASYTRDDAVDNLQQMPVIAE